MTGFTSGERHYGSRTEHRPRRKLLWVVEHVYREAIALLKMAEEELARLSTPEDDDAYETLRRVQEFLRAYGASDDPQHQIDRGALMATTTWRKELAEASVTEWVAVAPDESVLDVEFDDGFGSSEGPAVLIWTETHVWFPVVYDGSEWLSSVPRNPTKEAQDHVGGQ